MRTLGEAMADGAWAQDVGPNIALEALQEFLSLWNEVATWEPTAGVQDEFSWSWEDTGKFSVRSAYAANFLAREVAPAADLIWKSRAPSQCKFFIWLALLNRCWTSDRLARRGLPHQDACPFCDQEEESINTSCLLVFLPGWYGRRFVRPWESRSGCLQSTTPLRHGYVTNLGPTKPIPRICEPFLG